LLAAILLLLWENLSNDLFDADTGVDAVGKPHSVVNLTGPSGSHRLGCQLQPYSSV
jgi:1,4-dihydroxy-2-naphthoate octaprenyltransferase